jgi:prepilin-type processing-associated H-X9-DG protein
MAEWTDEATAYINGYLKQVEALATHQGVDADSLINRLRKHIGNNIQPSAEGVVDMSALSAVLSKIGSPEQIVNANNPLKTSPPQTPPPPPTPAPHQRRRQKKSSSTGCLIAAIVVPVVAIIMIAVMGILAAILLPALARAREAARRASCANNMKQIGLNLQIFSQENEGAYPALSDEPYKLMFSADDFYGNQDNLFSIFVCPSDATVPSFNADDFSSDAEYSNAIIDDHSYIYLSHVVTNDEEGQIYAAAYDAAMRAGNGFSHDFVGANGTVLPRLTSQTPYDPSVIPILIESDPSWTHIPGGGNVLFLDGHVEFIRMGEKFPMTEEFMGSLELINEQY